MSYYIDVKTSMRWPQWSLRPSKSFIVWTILFGYFFAAFARQDTGFTNSVESHLYLRLYINGFYHNNGNKLVQAVFSQRSLPQDAFQTCKTKRVGIFPEYIPPRCHTASTFFSQAIREVINLIPTEDKFI